MRILEFRQVPLFINNQDRAGVRLRLSLVFYRVSPNKEGDRAATWFGYRTQLAALPTQSGHAARGPQPARVLSQQVWR